MELALYSAVLALLLAVAFSFVHLFIRTVRHIPPFVPSARSAVVSLPSFLSLPPSSVFYDLGAGDGRMVRAMANAYPESICVGVERYWFPYLLSIVTQWFLSLPNVRFIRGDFHSIPLSEATHVYLYLFPQTIDALFPKFLSELKTGSMVVSCDFRCSLMEPDESIAIGTGRFGHTLYLYRI